MAAKGKTASTGPAHPGVSIAETVLTKLGLTQDQLAKLTGVSRRTINQLVNFRRNLTADMALRIAKVTGTDARHWLEQQIAYDLHQTEAALAKILSKIPHASSKPATPEPKPAPKAKAAVPAPAPAPEPKKAAPKKAAKKVEDKKPAPKKAAVKKTEAKKAEAKKPEVKKVEDKPAPKKKAAPKKAAVAPAPAAAPAPVKTAAPKKAAAKKAPAKPAKKK
ncbi:HigA family addiction module antitoxin [Zavarzinia compransoris]|uniref:Addiction module antidote protein, HigA family n=1 Tax=Zavarzinia compransoris TaxID=1264899 RepID=A0A317E1A8_9PROT|nr:HigA family addiction module antitoxin [Zavarzinia compransoris]PWR20877.1 addiction module antidote protein, HigA family [Zavarzinia compransoris]TDP44287.1 addiction module HigA family antidote [Zavarzinia compransoris]